MDFEKFNEIRSVSFIKDFDILLNLIRLLTYHKHFIKTFRIRFEQYIYFFLTCHYIPLFVFICLLTYH